MYQIIIAFLREKIPYYEIKSGNNEKIVVSLRERYLGITINYLVITIISLRYYEIFIVITRKEFFRIDVSFEKCSE